MYVRKDNTETMENKIDKYTKEKAELYLHEKNPTKRNEPLKCIHIFKVKRIKKETIY